MSIEDRLQELLKADKLDMAWMSQACRCVNDIIDLSINRRTQIFSSSLFGELTEKAWPLIEELNDKGEIK